MNAVINSSLLVNHVTSVSLGIEAGTVLLTVGSEKEANQIAETMSLADMEFERFGKNDTEFIIVCDSVEIRE